MDSPDKTTILIHGYGFDHRIWYPVELAFEGHHVIYLALPGFGMEPVTEAYTVAELAKKYWRHLDEIEADQVNLVGHSMGGYVCLEMLAHHPSRVSSLALVHSHVFADPAEKKEARNSTLNDIKTNGCAGLVNKLIPSLFADGQKSSGIIKMLINRGLQYDDNAWYFGTQAIRDRIDHSETLKTAHAPVLMLMGEADKAVPAELAYKQSSLAERTELHLYPDVGHMGMYENTSQMIGDLIRFYAGLGV